MDNRRTVKIPRIDRSRLIEVFRRAVEEEKAVPLKSPRPRTVAVRAHRLYCEDLPSDTASPALVSFTQRVAGRSADAAILEILKEGGIENRPHAVLDRARLIASFRETLERFRSRIERGIARPLQVAEAAHRLYTETQVADEIRPSRLTFRRLIYGQRGDPEIMAILNAYFEK